METRTLGYIALAFVVGGVHTLYDDLDDNPAFGARLPHRPYVKETLKILFILGFAVLSLRYITFYIILISLMIITYVRKPHDYKVYEISGLLGSVLLLPFLPWDTHKICDAQFIVLYAACAVLLKLLDSDDAEVSQNKVWLRSTTGVVLALALIAHHVYDFFEEGVAVFMAFIVGYTGFSTVYQMHMLRHPNPDGGSDNNKERPL